MLVSLPDGGRKSKAGRNRPTTPAETPALDHEVAPSPDERPTFRNPRRVPGSLTPARPCGGFGGPLRARRRCPTTSEKVSRLPCHVSDFDVGTTTGGTTHERHP